MLFPTLYHFVQVYGRHVFVVCAPYFNCDVSWLKRGDARISVNQCAVGAYVDVMLVFHGAVLSFVV